MSLDAFLLLTTALLLVPACILVYNAFGKPLLSAEWLDPVIDTAAS